MINWWKGFVLIFVGFCLAMICTAIHGCIELKQLEVQIHEDTQDADIEWNKVNMEELRKDMDTSGKLLLYLLEQEERIGV